MSKTTDIRDAVQAELDFDPLVDASDITIRNMNGDGAMSAVGWSTTR